MRRSLIFLLIFLLFPSASAAEAESPKYVALTFDDGPSGRYTRALLQGLEARNARATFFLCGYRLEQYPDLVGDILAGGHEIGLHGYSHDDLAAMSRREIAQELNRTRVLLPGDCRVRFLRPPGGSSSLAVEQVAGALGYALLDWSLDPRDWASRDAAAIGGSLVRGVRDGDIVLMHDMSESSVTAALNTVELLTRQGFKFVTVSELARLRGSQIRPGTTYRCFPKEEDRKLGSAG